MSWTDDHPTADEMPLRDLGTRLFSDHLSDTDVETLVRRSHFATLFNSTRQLNAASTWLLNLKSSEFTIYSNGVITIARAQTLSGTEIFGAVARGAHLPADVKADITLAITRAAFAAMRNVVEKAEHQGLVARTLPTPVTIH